MFGGSLEKYWRLQFEFKGESFVDLAYFTLETSSRHFFAFAAAESGKILRFAGSAISNQDRPLLTNALNAVDPEVTDLGRPLKQMKFSFQKKEPRKPRTKFPLRPENAAFLAQNGDKIFHCKIRDEKLGELRETKVDPAVGRPSSTLVLTDFHAVTVAENSVEARSLLNDRRVFFQEFDDTKVKGAGKDDLSGNVFFAFSDYEVRKFKLDREDRNVWKIFMEKGDFDAALSYSSDDPDKLNEVLSRRAERLFDLGEYLESAMTFSKTSAEFETIALKFLKLEDKTAIMNFLKKKLETIEPADLTQLMLVVIWLTENYLTAMQSDPDLEEEYLNLLENPKVGECVRNSSGRNAIYDLLQNHGANRILLQLAESLGDFDIMIKHHLRQSDYSEVIRILRRRRSPELWAKYGPEFIQQKREIVRDFVDGLISMGDRIKSDQALSVLILCSRDYQELEAIRYLEFCVDKLARREAAIHNFLISLYVKHRPEQLEPYLSNYLDVGVEVPYDIEYTLRIFREEGDSLRKEIFILYCVLGQLDEAVEIALDLEDLDMAQRTLEFSRDDDQRRKIWLHIARFVVQKKQDIKQAMDYMRQSGDLVKIEDILPFFPDFVTIDHFKEAICDSLSEYSQHIERLRAEMEESNLAADQVRKEISAFKEERHVIVKAAECCEACSKFLMTRAFHLFGCGHKFHSDCLAEQHSKIKRLADVNRECPYCGNGIIESVDKPLLDSESISVQEWF